MKQPKNGERGKKEDNGIRILIAEWARGSQFLRISKIFPGNSRPKERHYSFFTKYLVATSGTMSEQNNSTFEKNGHLKIIHKEQNIFISFLNNKYKLLIVLWFY